MRLQSYLVTICLFIQILPQNSIAQDLSFLKEELKNKEFVLLGEPKHESHFYAPKIQLVKYLHEELGYNVLAFESGLFELFLVNEELKELHATEVAHKGLFPIWSDDPEFFGLLTYLDQQAKAGNPLYVAGFDCQPSGNYSANELVEHLKSKLTSHPIPSSSKALSIIQRELSEVKKYYRISPSLSDNDLQVLKAFEKEMSEIPGLLLYLQITRNWRLYFQHLQENPTPDFTKFKASDSNFRDSLMAVNFLFIHESLFPGKKIIGWGATAHFAKGVNELKMKTNEHLRFQPMGSHLQKSLGDKVYTLSVTSNSEEEDTWETELTANRIQHAWRGTEELKSKSFGSTCLSQWATGNWSKTIDGILFALKPESLSVQQGWHGVVLDSKNNQPVSFASLWVEGTDRGTASNENGEFFLPETSIPDHGMIRISSIGYETKYLTIKELMKLKGRLILKSEDTMLDEVVIKATSINPKEYIREAIRDITTNYYQKPFGIDFYSTLKATDSVGNDEYKIETLIQGYYEGYSPMASKNFRIIQKRETGKNFLKDTQLNAIWPPFEIIASDLISNQNRDGIFNLEHLEKFDFKISKIDFFEGDSIIQINYNLPKVTSKITGYASSIKKYEGQITISLKDRAILKHQLSVWGFTNFDFTILYRKSGTTYFPYYIKGVRTYRLKTPKEEKEIKQKNEIYITRILTENPEVFSNNMKLWEPANIKFDPEFWQQFAPLKK